MLRIEPFDWGELRQIKTFTLRHAFGDIHYGDVAKFLETSKQRECAADLTSSNQTNFLTCHDDIPLFRREGREENPDKK
jgi:hypothetical protein